MSSLAPAASVRNSNLDLLRAMAILMVVTYHVIQMCPIPLPHLTEIAHAGQYGVDLFFVLSGWLIGGLYWSERTRFGNVELGRFWARRWLRTIPPYLVALAISWLAVFLQRGEPFDLGYCIFIQNYYERLPFFLVSWSLCVEEHFYLVVPLVLAFAYRAQVVTLLCLLPIPAALVMRCLQSPDALASQFGFVQTATHLRMEGLLLGVWLAHVHAIVPRNWVAVERASRWGVACMAVALVAIQLAPPVLMYRLGLTTLALGLAGVLVLQVERKAGRVASSPVVKAIAQASYSVYLIHPLMIHAAREITEGRLALPWQTYFPAVGILVAGGGALFYFGIERTSIVLRDRWVPRRPRSTPAA